MYRITREVCFSYGHRLLHHEGKCGRLHGHNGRLRITLASETLDAAGMVVDFLDIKRLVTQWVEENLDHRMILNRDDPAVAALQALGEPLCVVGFNPTAENLARHVFQHLRTINLPVAEVLFEETANCSASFSREREGLSH